MLNSEEIRENMRRFIEEQGGGVLFRKDLSPRLISIREMSDFIGESDSFKKLLESKIREEEEKK